MPATFWSLLLSATVAFPVVGADLPWASGQLPAGADAPRPTVAPGTPVQDLRLPGLRYATPAMPFILRPAEDVVRITLAAGSAEEGQQRLDAAHAEHPTAVVVATLTGTITIGAVPLRLPGRTSLIVGAGGSVIASPSATAPALLVIEDTELVGVGGEALTVDGRGRDLIGVRITGSGKIHLDHLVVRGCTIGIDIHGRGAERTADPVSLTRSSVTECAGDAVAVADSAQFIALDNRLTGNRGAALRVEAPGALLANNIAAANGTGFVLAGSDHTVTRNLLVGNQVGLRVEATAKFVVVEGNVLQDNRLGAEVLGSQVTVAWNRFANARQIVTGGAGNLLLANAGLTAADASAPGTSYFHPPTMTDRHQETVLWKGERVTDHPRSRREVTIAAVAGPMPDEELNRRLQDARDADHDDMLVVTLRGRFEVASPTGIRIPDFTCILLEGTIAQVGAEPRDRLVQLAGRGGLSFSGGRVEGTATVKDGISAQATANTAVIDGVAIDLGTPVPKEGLKSLNGISTKGHQGPLVVRGCTFTNPGFRAVWIHASSRNLVLDSTCTGGGLTLDFDAHASHSAALYNTLGGNGYHSTIFIEEAVKNATVFANRSVGNAADGIVLFNAEVKGTTTGNLVACNDMADNSTNGRSDLSFGGKDEQHRCDGNYAFNNRIARTGGRGAITLKANSADNYLAQSVISDCPKILCNLATRPIGDDYGANRGWTDPQR